MQIVQSYRTKVHACKYENFALCRFGKDLRGDYKARVNHQIMDLIESRSTSALVCQQSPTNANENLTDPFMILDKEVSQGTLEGCGRISLERGNTMQSFQLLSIFLPDVWWVKDNPHIIPLAI